MDELKAIRAELKASKKKEATIEWINNDQFCEALKISKRSAQNYRDQGMIPFSVVGGKVYYKLKDVEELLNSNYKK